MRADAIMVLVIISIVAAVMVIIGVCQFCKKETPVGFYNVGEPPKREEITNIRQWNRKHGMIWIAYGICIELGYWIAYFMPNEALEAFFMIGSIIIPLPLMILRHHMLEKMYRI